MAKTSIDHSIYDNIFGYVVHASEMQMGTVGLAFVDYGI